MKVGTIIGVTTGAGGMWAEPRLSCTAWQHLDRRQATHQAVGTLSWFYNWRWRRHIRQRAFWVDSTIGILRGFASDFCM